MPFGIDIHLESMGLFLYFLTEKLTAKERAAFAKGIGLSKREIDQWQKLEAKVEEAGEGPEVGQAAEAVARLSAAVEVAGRSDPVPAGALFRAPGARPHPELSAEVSAQRAGSHRADVLATGAKPGTPKFQKVREELILTQAGRASEEGSAAGSAAAARARWSRKARGWSAWETRDCGAGDGAEVSKYR